MFAQLGQLRGLEGMAAAFQHKHGLVQARLHFAQAVRRQTLQPAAQGAMTTIIEAVDDLAVRSLAAQQMRYPLARFRIRQAEQQMGLRHGDGRYMANGH